MAAPSFMLYHWYKGAEIYLDVSIRGGGPAAHSLKG